ncbi:acetate/propionate family kinase [Knoellia locipacati]|uniref:acetate/propionate family kinase n=1 Tax=Knoellia locipacati TaxID=882824 RepID=UPI003851266A
MGARVTGRALVVNAGSSSLKLRMLSGSDNLEHSADLVVGADGPNRAELVETLSSWGAPDLVGHRVVHGGPDLTSARRIDASVRTQIEALCELAPLHQPAALSAIDAVGELMPEVPAFASFDTAFHATIPAAASTYALPRAWRARHGIRRYGFHGLSHAYASRRAAQLVERPLEELRVITCHLGAGASIAAVHKGISVDTTMGFTPLEGLVMATRSGSVDPGLILWLQEHEAMGPREMAAILERESGLLALTGAADLRVVETAAAQGDPDSQLGLEVYLHRLVAGIGAMVATTNGLDVLVFTGGVGENSALVRQRVSERLSHLGVKVRAYPGNVAAGDVDMSESEATVRTLIIAAREDLQIAREAREAQVNAPPLTGER